MVNCLLVNEATNEVVRILYNGCGYINVTYIIGTMVIILAVLAVIGWFIWVTGKCNKK